MGLFSEKMEGLCAKLNGRAKVATGSYSATGDSLQHFILCMWLKIIETPDQDV